MSELLEPLSCCNFYFHSGVVTCRDSFHDNYVNSCEIGCVVVYYNSRGLRHQQHFVFVSLSGNKAKAFVVETLIFVMFSWFLKQSYKQIFGSGSSRINRLLSDPKNCRNLKISNLFPGAMTQFVTNITFVVVTK